MSAKLRPMALTATRTSPGDEFAEVLGPAREPVERAGPVDAPDVAPEGHGKRQARLISARTRSRSFSVAAMPSRSGRRDPSYSIPTHEV